MNARTDDRAPHLGADDQRTPPGPADDEPAPPGPADDERTPPRSPESQSAERPLVLLVEDSDPDRDVYGGLLWYNGYDVAHAPDGPGALEKALELSPALILMDLTLAGTMDGLEVARRLREEGVTVPIVALTAHPRDEKGEAAAGAGITGYLEKPISPFEVVKEVIRRIGHASRDR